MPGSLVRDANAPTLLDAYSLSGGSTTGSAVKANWPQDVQVELVIASLAGTSPTVDVEVEVADDSAFTQNVRSLCAFPQHTANGTYGITTYVDAPYVRAKVTTGGTISAGTATVKLREPHLDRTPGTTPEA
ncbi:MAG: hypothetical protein D6746_14305 [Bacteroidetes bacterium]|nr:MAG: hypothetical protein D6746_14305 [Bacteroidota bacterium]